MRAGLVRDLRVDVERDDVLRADELGKDRRVVARARTDLEDALASLETKRVDHQRHDRDLARRADRIALVAVLRRYRGAAVDAVEVDVGEEEMPRHAAER